MERFKKDLRENKKVYVKVANILTSKTDADKGMVPLPFITQRVGLTKGTRAFNGKTIMQHVHGVVDVIDSQKSSGDHKPPAAQRKIFTERTGIMLQGNYGGIVVDLDDPKLFEWREEPLDADDDSQTTGAKSNDSQSDGLLKVGTQKPADDDMVPDSMLRLADDDEDAEDRADSIDLLPKKPPQAASPSSKKLKLKRPAPASPSKQVKAAGKPKPAGTDAADTLAEEFLQDAMRAYKKLRRAMSEHDA